MEKPNFLELIKFKFKLLYNGLMQRPMRMFFTFLILQGLSMPSFSEFDYFFALDVLKIPLVTVNL